jgi:hypothetical protein
MALELRHLRGFVAVAQTLHFARAAEALGLSAPALTEVEEVVAGLANSKI